jgi:sugar phosphate isomerase/epimerase
MDLTLPLEPHAFVAHPELPLAYHPALGEEPQPMAERPASLNGFWQESLGESLERLAELARPVPLAVENLQYPFAWVWPLVKELDLGVTLDVGHLLKAGGEVDEHLCHYGHRLTVIHLHGVIDGRDHQPITSYSKEELRQLLHLFRAVKSECPAARASAAASTEGAPLVVSLEVFGWESTVPSLRYLAECLDDSEKAGRLRAAASATMELVPRHEKPTG